ncbi:PREDICTED: uncharacterized protein LOC106804784 [Priapulus caudatus]|uniref:Uncharacterized protein LOC106804784 n=1 Tax=Priapulus caudatus TaxID=37621 RepID=A0ABM1DNT6_PRICU|nr:PREDICTED: uncharacterized protein LOC106804784 [Priapulus caudatus]
MGGGPSSGVSLTRPRSARHPNAVLQPSAVLANSREDVLPGSLCLLHTCLLDDWIQIDAGLHGFREKVLRCYGMLYKDCSTAYCSNRHGVLSNSPLSAHMRRKSRTFGFKPHSRLSDHFEYNHIPAQLQTIQRIYVRGVIAVQGDLVVMDLLRTSKANRFSWTLFGLLDLKRNKFLGTFGEQSFEVLKELLYCQVSPDKSKCLVVIPDKTPGEAARGDLEFFLRVYETQTLQELSCIRLSKNYFKTQFVFSPCFRCERLAITNIVSPGPYSPSVSLVENILDPSVMRTVSILDEVGRASVAHIVQPFISHLLYTKDGSVLLASLNDGRCTGHARASRRNRYSFAQIFVLCAESLCILSVVDYTHSTCALHQCSINYTPVYSQCGSRMAVISYRQRYAQQDDPSHEQVRVYQLPVRRTLQNFCRVKILHHVPLEKVYLLPLPVRLLDYLRFEAEYL